MKSYSIVLAIIVAAGLVADFTIGGVRLPDYATQLAVGLTLVMATLLYDAFKQEIIGLHNKMRGGHQLGQRIDMRDPDMIARQQLRSDGFNVILRLLYAGFFLFVAYQNWEWVYVQSYDFRNRVYQWVPVLTYGDGIGALFFSVAIVLILSSVRKARKLRRLRGL